MTDEATPLEEALQQVQASNASKPAGWVEVAEEVVQVVLLALNTAAKVGAFNLDHFKVIGDAVEHLKAQFNKAKGSAPNS